MPRIMVIFGTRPEAIKMAPVVKALHADRRFQLVTVTTGQHRQMLDQVLRLFQIVPDVDLDLITPRQTLDGMTSRILGMLTPELERAKPDLVLVQGDTTTAFVSALVAFYRRIPVAHLEAGLRTGDIWSPYPEEANRRMISQLAALHLAPTRAAADNLYAEGTARHAVVVTGNTIIDALLSITGLPVPYGDAALADLDEDRRRVLLVTAHRRESWGAPLRGVARALAELAATEPDLRIVLPVHRNPVVREALCPLLAGRRNVTIVNPVEYAGFCRLMNRSHLVLTDSGGVQEEAPSLGKPVLVIRDTTERPEGIRAGTARLIGTDPAAIVGAVRTLLHDRAAYAEMAGAVNPYGDGRAAERVVGALAHFFDVGAPPDPFVPLVEPRRPLPSPAVLRGPVAAEGKVSSLTRGGS